MTAISRSFGHSATRTHLILTLCDAVSSLGFSPMRFRVPGRVAASQAKGVSLLRTSGSAESQACGACQRTDRAMLEWCFTTADTPPSAEPGLGEADVIVASAWQCVCTTEHALCVRCASVLILREDVLVRVLSQTL